MSYVPMLRARRWPRGLGDALVDSYADPLDLSSRTGADGGFDANMAAIVDFFNAATPGTNTSAAAIKDQFAKWYAGLNLSWWNVTLDQDATYATARNYRDSYNTAIDPAAAAWVQNTGLTSEQQYNEDAKARLADGSYATPPAAPLSLGWQIAIGVVVGGSILLFAYGTGKSLPGALLDGGKKAHAPNRRAQRRARS